MTLAWWHGGRSVSPRIERHTLSPCWCWRPCSPIYKDLKQEGRSQINNQATVAVRRHDGRWSGSPAQRWWHAQGSVHNAAQIDRQHRNPAACATDSWAQEMMLLRCGNIGNRLGLAREHQEVEWQEPTRSGRRLTKCYKITAQIPPPPPVPPSSPLPFALTARLPSNRPTPSYHVQTHARESSRA